MSGENDVLPPRYRDPSRVGQGGMGDIYRATDSLLNRDVAVKVLARRYAEDEEVRQRFTREALTAARLSGEAGIVTIFDVGEWNGRPFIVMEYLPGGSLEERLRSGVPDVGQALRWLEEAARALDAGHRRGVVHRDVKPGNLIVDHEEHVHVADFGIASATGLHSLTMTGTVLGTAGYLAPEQAIGDRATPASDRYALAVVGWELIAGERPFASDSPTAEATAHAHAPVPSLCERRPDLPCRELDAVFGRALAKDPGERYGSCAEFVADLRHALAAGAPATQVLPRAVPAAAPRRPSRVAWVALGALLLGALLAGAVVAATLTDGDEPAAREPSTTVRNVTVTEPGTTVTTAVTVTTAPTTAPPTTAPTTAAVPPGGRSVETGIELTDEATLLLRDGDYEGAATKAGEALQHLGGTGELYEAYALYDLGAALIALGDCKDGLKHIRRSEKIQGPRSELDEARAQCRGGGGRDGDDDE